MYHPNGQPPGKVRLYRLHLRVSSVQLLLQRLSLFVRTQSANRSLHRGTSHRILPLVTTSIIGSSLDPIARLPWLRTLRRISTLVPNGVRSSLRVVSGCLTNSGPFLQEATGVLERDRGLFHVRISKRGCRSWPPSARPAAETLTRPRLSMQRCLVQSIPSTGQ